MHPRAPRSPLTKTRQTHSRRVHDLVIASVLEGDLGAESVLVEETLAREYDASRNAVREALQSLATEGILERGRRVGTHVAGPFTTIDIADATPGDPAGEPVLQKVVDAHVMPATPMLRRLLALGDDEPDVRMVENLFIRAGAVIGVRSAYYSTRYASIDYPVLASMPDVIRVYFGEELVRVRTSIGATLTDDRTGRLLGMRSELPLIFRQQLYFGAGDRPIQLVFDHYRSDKVLLTSNQ